MKKMLGLALLASTAAVGVASAEEGSFSGNVGIATDYMFRGISQTQNGPAIQGGFDYSNGMFYAGTWASNIDFGLPDGSTEIDIYAGVKPVVGPVSLDFGIIGYFYPNASDDAPAGELDYWEAKAAASFAPIEGWSVGGALFYSPEFTGELGDALYAELNTSVTLTEMVSVSAAVGQQSVDQADFDLTTAAQDDEYTTYNIGVTGTLAGFTADLRWHDTDDVDLAPGPGVNDVADGRVVFSLKRAL